MAKTTIDRLIITLNMTRVVQHIWDALRFENTERLEPVFDRDHPIRATGDMSVWYTGKPCERASKSHINFCVYDSAWEASDAYVLDHHSGVTAWVKNDHLGFEVLYIYRGVVRKYRPDFLIRLNTAQMLILETKGQDQGCSVLGSCGTSQVIFGQDLHDFSAIFILSIL